MATERQADPTISVAINSDSEVAIEPYFTRKKKARDLVEWQTRTAEIKSGETGESIFKAENIEVPSSWSQTATDIVAEKYFRFCRHQPTGNLVREKSVWAMVNRVATTIATWGKSQGYFKSDRQAEIFREELSAILVTQRAAFNSPVWFNLGVESYNKSEQVSACFINSVEDSMDSILELARTEGKLYKGGSGSGVNYSSLRSSKEKLSNGGYSSGPVSFIAKDDANGGAIKSGGSTRRAAKIAILNVNHPDILEFIECKAKAEKAAQALIDAGFNGDFRDRYGAYGMVPFQNANHSVRVSDDFLSAVESNLSWYLLAKDGSVLQTVQAREIWDSICKAAWECGDPGLQFDTTINKWHTCPSHGRINGSNPCSEYMHLDDSACNLASINLLKFYIPGSGATKDQPSTSGVFDVDGFKHTVAVLITAMDILVDGASYPTDKIADNAHKFRQLGLGFSNLGALLMTQGIAYDSDSGRRQAGLISSLMAGQAYRQSAYLASIKGSFEGFHLNRASMLSVVDMHYTEHKKLVPTNYSEERLFAAAGRAWRDSLTLGELSGIRNSQVCVIAPTGTISFLMDCDTTGIEPELNLVKRKKLVGGGTIKIINQRVGDALTALGYLDDERKSIEDYVMANGSVRGVSGVRSEHLSVFDSSFADPVENVSLRPEAHVMMMAAVQPFMSGAISKTVNLPEHATVYDVGCIYTLAWKLGLKSITVYRDGCKRTQPIGSAFKKDTVVDTPQVVYEHKPTRKKLPPDVVAKRHKFTIGQQSGYFIVGMYEDGKPAEIFIQMNRQGSLVSGLMSGLATVMSIALQYGVPLEELTNKFLHTRFSPDGITANPDPDLRFASSPLDYIARYLNKHYSGVEKTVTTGAVPTAVLVEKVVKTLRAEVTGDTCSRCGNLMQQTGACKTCSTCGLNEGCG